MKTISIFMMTALFAMASNASADELKVNDFTVESGETKTVSVELNNTDNSYIAFEFYMSLPEGINIDKDEYGEFMVDMNSSRSSRHILEVAQNADGSYHFLCYSNSNSVFKGTEGELLSITLTADNSLEGGPSQQGLLYHQKLSDSDMNKVVFPDQSFNITVNNIQEDTPITIIIPESGVTTFSCKKSLDFSDVTDFEAYIIAGYDRDEKTVYAMPVSHVSAGVGLYLVGQPGTYNVPIITNHTNYTNMLVGVNNTVNISSSEGLYANLTLSTDGATPLFTAIDSTITMETNTAYLQLPSALYDGCPVSVKLEESTDGDLNKDGIVCVNDVMLLVKMILGQ